MTVLGVDVSAWQYPGSVNWQQLRGLGYSFAYVRGVKMGREIDVHAAEHVSRARDAGFRVGIYSFFVPTVPADRQIELAADAHGACGMHPGDLAPALDVESYEGHTAGPSWVQPVIEILDGLTVLYQSALRYHNLADWIMLGKPTALERWPLWLADYSPPADLPCVIWQHRSAPIDGYGTAALDQNAAIGELPTIGPRDDAVKIVSPSEIAIPWPRWDRPEHDRLRNIAVERNG